MEYLINNSEEESHSNTINSLLEEIVCFDCMVAFAKTSGFRMIEKTLIDALERNQDNPQARFRFIFGLDFYQTEPDLLYKILELTGKYNNLSLFLSTDDCVFHPKVYAFKTTRAKNYVVIGSANLTRGGLLNNNESSLLVNSTEMRKTVLSQIKQLIENNEIIKATEDNISEYEEKYNIYNVRKIFFERKTKDAIQNPVEGDFETLEAILDLMKQNSEFEQDVARRIKSRKYAIKQLNSIANEPNINAQSFLKFYEPLVQNPQYWHSSGLARQKNIIANNAILFQSALRFVTNQNNLTPREAYLKFDNIKGAGKNAISEVLHSIDNTRFAVMNENSIAGMNRANYFFPNNTTCQVYQEFCNNAKNVCQAFELNNFTELDALLNYAYFNIDE